MTDTDTTPPAAIAPWGHTAKLVLILTAVAASGYAIHAWNSAGGAGAIAGARDAASAGVMLYASLILAEFGLFWLVRAGLRRGGVRIAALISRRPLGARTLLFDVLLGLGVFGDLVLLELLLARGGHSDPGLVQQMIVHRPGEVLLWIGVSLAAGFVEELTFRGYLQRQLASRVGMPLAILGQAAMFGLVHGYQGPAMMVGISVLGIAFGLLAWGRGSLVPGMVAHAAIDIFGGLQLLR